MQSTLNILWKKSKKSNLYTDIFTLRPLSDFHLEPLIDQMFLSQKSPNYQKNNSIAALLREKGKTLFAVGKYMDAMNAYNEALKHAENGSTELALAYANRSACFLHLNMPEECMKDIELAKKSKYPSHLMHKLDARAVKCAELLMDKQSGAFTPMEPQLSFDEHKEFAGVADCLEIRRNVEFGRHVVTTRDLKVSSISIGLLLLL